MKAITKTLAILLAIVCLGTLIALPVSAKDYSECWSGNTGTISISNRTNSLIFRNPHGNFKLRIYVTAPLFVSRQYSIWMYDNAGRCVWSASNQGDRTYDIGSNVVRIVTTTNASVGITLYWQKK